MTQKSAEHLLQLDGISKYYGSFKANDRIDLSIMPGEIHALLGENGAGKSTLVKMLYGSLQPDEGQILWQGQKVNIANPAEARTLGIGMVFQHFSLFDALTVAENIALAMPKDQKLSDISKRLEAVSQEYGLPLKAGARIHDLSVGERQRVEIVRCLLQEPKLLILDEPTSVLTPQESEDLFKVLRRLSDEGTAILYISHKLAEVQALCQNATILRHGEVVADCIPANETPLSLAKMMVGDDIHEIAPRATGSDDAKVILKVTGLSATGLTGFETSLKDVNFSVRTGEIAGIAGIAGNGQNELFAVLSGERTTAPDMVQIDGEPVGGLSILQRRKKGAMFVSEERLGHAAVPEMSLSDNVVLTRHGLEDDLQTGPFVRHGTARKLKDKITEMFDVRKGNDDPPAMSLSGGNLQKFVLGREVMAGAKLVIVNQPTWGVDAGSAAQLRQNLIDLAATGAAILVISQDLDELFEISDRLATMAEGELSPFVPTAKTNRNEVGLKMTGVFAPAEGAH
ncbi:galactose/methyl galactoside import ATP-binding protein MglA [Maritalea myrionectae]|uniref:Galactose/methyl galactoside import ATP-binding protein MglA n=1 Tax=Maritalea myrionectae TaxID=454601 RepID=A0A2R4M9H8_9HYPH|nr:ABC transporter ATP-binding protein [Maritalea myrionectae]AVX02670.1 galactose/methyl galactoside import ATP-binding protein MglA [Maritalea myrionectae]